MCRQKKKNGELGSKIGAIRYVLTPSSEYPDHDQIQRGEAFENTTFKHWFKLFKSQNRVVEKLLLTCL